MAYRSQLVIRTSEAKGAEVLKRVKELADGESKTISEKAIELLAEALDGPRPAAVRSKPEPKVEEEADEPEEAVESVVRRDPGPALQPPSVKEKDPKIRPDEAPHAAADRCVELFGDEGAEAAAQALTDFFAAAEPVDGEHPRRVTGPDVEVRL